MTIFFNFSEITIQVSPASDLCIILKNGTPIWSGTARQLTTLLQDLLKEKKKDAPGDI